ncbi:MAG: hypothetical protein HY200_05155 [Nitrospirae bacterium]|nr:hypothetical protein [Nitrospirota bacterium]MBI3594327.1 hypothetical protein [Nitrospirota bacterium]
MVNSLVPVKVIGLTEAVAIAAGDWHSCAVLKNGEVKCWGANKLGQLGYTGSLEPSPKPISVHINSATQIVAGRTHTCALLTDGTVSCWGDNRNSQTGVQRESMAKPSLPVIVPKIMNVVSIAAGNEHSCAAQSDGSLFCWGDNHFGQLGTGIQAHQFFPPSKVPISGEALVVTAGRRHSCALLKDHTVQCWGKGFEGQLGDGRKKDSLTPVKVTNLNPNGVLIAFNHILTISSGSQHTCALLENREVHCWGSNYSGQLGTFHEDFSPQPVFSGLSDVVSLSAGGWHTCAIFSNGETKCVGKLQPTGPED